MFTLVVADNSDGTCTATVAGSLGAPVTIFTMRIVGVGLVLPWSTTTYTRTGDGTLSIALPAGGYWFYAASASAVAPPAFSRISDGLDAVRTRILAAVVTVCELLALEQCEAVRIRTKRPVGEARDEYPCLEVWRMEPDDDRQLMHWKTQVGYKVPIIFKQKNPLGQADMIVLGDRWHQSLARTFSEPDAIRAVVPEVWNQTVRGPSYPEGNEQDREYAFGGLVLEFHALEPKGFGA